MTPQEQEALRQQLLSLQSGGNERAAGLREQLAQVVGQAGAQLGTSGLGGFNDSLNSAFGTQFRDSESIANRRATLLSGNDPIAQGLRTQITESNDTTDRGARDIRDRIKAEREELKFQIDLEKGERDKLKFEDGRRLNDARINKLNRLPVSKASKKDADSANNGKPRRTSLFGFFNKVGQEVFSGDLTDSGKQSLYIKPFENARKNIDKEVQVVSRANNALKILNDRTEGGSLRRTGIQAVKTMLAKASGEVGNLTQAERDQFGGDQSLFSSISRWTALQSAGDFTNRDIEGLTKLANVFVEGSKERESRFARSAVNSVKGSLGVTNKELIENNAGSFFGGSLSNVQLGLESQEVAEGRDREVSQGNENILNSIPSSQPAQQSISQQSGPSIDDDIDSLLGNS